MTRLQAFGIHLAISAAIFAGLAALIVAVWYPEFFFATDGGWQGLRIILAVDLVLGPALTLIVWKAGKPGLTFDISCIAALQAVCLLAGTYLVYSERPLVMVYVDGYFTSLSADSFADAGLEVPDLSDLPGGQPKWVMVDVPEDVFEQADLRRSMIRRGLNLTMAVDRYLPFDAQAEAFVNESYNVSDILNDAGTELPQWLARQGGSVDEYRFYPYGSRYSYLFLAYRDDTSEFLGLLDKKVPI